MSDSIETYDSPLPAPRGETFASHRPQHVGKVSSSQLTTLILFIVLGLSTLIYLFVLAPDKFGVEYDDSICATTAKALATGQGYRIISLPYQPAQTKYPPFYPSLLAMIWKVSPRFPQNLIWMMLLSVAATVIFLAMTYRYLAGQGYATPFQSLIVVAMASLNLRTMVLATTVSSEMPYAALSIIVLHLAERYANKGKGWVTALAVGVTTGLAFLTRTSGLALLIAIAVYYAAARDWKRGVWPVAVGSLFVAGWMGWCYSNRTLAEGVNVAYYTNYWRDFNEIVGTLQTINHQSKPTVVVEILARNIFGYILVSVSLCSGIAYQWVQYFGFAFFIIAAGFIRQVSKRLRLLHIYIISYLALLLPWPYTSYSRFLIPVLPFLLLFIVIEFDRLISLVRRELMSRSEVTAKVSAAFIGLLLLLSAGVTFFSYGSDLYRSLASSSLNKNSRPAREDAEALDWIRTHVDQSDVISCSRDPLYYLYTERKATRSFPVNMSEAVLPQTHQQAEIQEEESKLLLRILSDNNVEYLISTSSDFGYDTDVNAGSLNVLIRDYPRMFSPVFESTDGHSRIYRVNMEEASPQNRTAP